MRRPRSTRTFERAEGRNALDRIRDFYEPSPELFKGLGEVYVADERFKATYEKIAPGLADWMRMAMAAFSARDLKNN